MSVGIFTALKAPLRAAYGETFAIPSRKITAVELLPSSELAAIEVELDNDSGQRFIVGVGAPLICVADSFRVRAADGALTDFALGKAAGNVTATADFAYYDDSARADLIPRGRRPRRVYYSGSTSLDCDVAAWDASTTGANQLTIPCAGYDTAVILLEIPAASAVHCAVECVAYTAGTESSSVAVPLSRANVLALAQPSVPTIVWLDCRGADWIRVRGRHMTAGATPLRVMATLIPDIENGGARGSPNRIATLQQGGNATTKLFCVQADGWKRLSAWAENLDSNAGDTVTLNLLAFHVTRSLQNEGLVSSTIATTGAIPGGAGSPSAVAVLTDPSEIAPATCYVWQAVMSNVSSAYFEFFAEK